MNNEPGAITGVKLRRVLIKSKPYVEILIGGTILRLTPDAAMELCSGLYEACTNEKLERVRLKAMIGDTKINRRQN